MFYRCSLKLLGLLVALSIALCGCGGDTKQFLNVDSYDAPTNVAPVVEFSSLILSGNVVEVCYNLTDLDEDRQDITPEYSIDGGLTFRPATESLVPSPGGITSEGVVQLTASPTGTFHCYVWDAAFDGVGTDVPTTINFRITSFDGTFASPPAVSGPITLFNPALLVDIGTTSGLFGTPDLQVPLTLTTGGTSPATVTVTVEFDSTLLVPSLVPALEGPVATAVGATILGFDQVGSQVTVIIGGGGTLGDGVIAFLAFDALVPAVPVSTATPIICISVEAMDAGLAPIGAACGNSGSILLFPNQPPTCTVTSPVAGDVFTILSGFTGVVTIGFTLYDDEGDPVDLLIEYTTDSGATWQFPTEIPGPPSSGTTNLPALPTGTSYTYVWDAIGDMPSLTAAAATTDLRITPQRAGGGIPGPSCTSGEFILDLRNAPPTCVQPITETGGSLDITITFDITDVEDDPVDVYFEFEAPPGSGWQPATPAPTSPLANPALGLLTPVAAATFIWDSLADGVANTAATAPTDVQFRITSGDPFNPLLPLPPLPTLIVCDTGGTFPIDNWACVFNSLVVLGPLSALGEGPNVVGGGPTFDDPCTIGTDYTFSLGSANIGELTDVFSFNAGGNPLVFDIDGQTYDVIVEGSFAGSCGGFQDLTAETTIFGDTTYAITPGPGGPYVEHLGNGTFRSLATAPVQQGGCDTVDVTFTPNGMGTTGGSDGTPMTVTFAACVDYYGWDTASRDGAGLLPIGAIDADMFGTPSGMPTPGVGGQGFIGFYGSAPAGVISSAFDVRVTYDSTFIDADISYGSNGARTCSGLVENWTITPNPKFGGVDVFLVNGFRIATNPASAGPTLLCTMAFQGIASGATSMSGSQEEWADETATTIPGPQPLPWVNPAMCSGFRVP